MQKSIPTRSLREHPDLDQLKRQAKELLKAFSAGDAQAIAEVNAHYRAADPTTFALHDAQLVLARAYGFESWPKLKAYVDGVTVTRLVDAVRAGDIARVRAMLKARPELVNMDMSENNEHRALHYAVLARSPEMVRLLMQHGADARKGIWPHRDATSAFAIARDRDYRDVVDVIEEEELRRREQVSCPNLTVSPVQDQISAAISKGDNNTAMRLLQEDPFLINACDRNGATPLHIAAEQMSIELVSWLLERGAGARKIDLKGLTALDRAALAADPRDQSAQRFPEIARLLLQRGAELTIRAAVALGDESRIRDLILANPDLLRQIDFGGGLLTLAVNHGQLDALRLLLDLGADVDERIVLQNVEEPTPSWGMPLWHAARAGHLDIARLLLDRGADPNANVYASGWPLLNAWANGHDAVKQLLLERGATVKPYMLTEFHDVAGAKRLLAEDPGEKVASELAWSAADHGCPEIVEMALSHLDWPASSPQWHWVLIQPVRGAHANPAENDGHFKSMAALLKHGIDPNVTRYGQTVLHFTAAHHGQLADEDRARFASMLLDAGARMDLRDDLLKSTPLGWACRWGRFALAKLLLHRGADPTEPDAETWAHPLAWAEKMGHAAIVDLLAAT